MSDIEDRWIAPHNKCDCCGRKKENNELLFCEDHVTMGISGFNFTWCPDCEKNRQTDCDKIMMDCLQSWKKQCQEHWKNKKGE